MFIEGGRLHVDTGLGTAVRLPEAETLRRRVATTAEWPILHLVLRGVGRDQMMARHKANHVQVAYAPGDERARHALACKAATFHAMGIRVHPCGDTGLEA